MALSSISLLATAQFTPGEGGALPTFPTFTSLPNKFGGFKVTSSLSEIYTIETSTAIFPNPTSDVINIQSEDIIKEVILIGVNGEIAKNIIANSDNITFNVSNLSSGMYVLHINTDNAMITRKIEIKR
jgi:Secretion system C-terminal sorting domain